MSQPKTNPQVPEWVTKIKELYERGASDVEVCKEMKITQKRFDELYDDVDNAGFRTLVDMGRTMSKAFWYEQARKSLWDKTFNSPVWMFVMKNRFGWSEKSENIERSDTPVNQQSLDEIRSRLLKALPGIAKQLDPSLKDTDLLGNGLPN